MVNVKAANPMGTRPRAAKTCGENRPSWVWPSGNPPAASTGAAHHQTSALASPAIAMAVRPVSASLTSVHRVLVTDWFHASRNVPASSSREISGAPQNAPVAAGNRYRTAPPRK
jgi:hypothetical protein